MSDKRAFTAIGVDGCKGGWFFVKIDPSGAFRAGVVTHLRKLVEEAGNTDRIFIDIPIGLPNGPPDSANCERQCDKEGRRFIGRRRSSVFPAPSRDALDFAHSYSEATKANKRALGKGLTKQTFAIVAKIKEVDELISGDERAKRLVREVHPEVCFKAFACIELKNSKKTHNGFWERMSLLREFGSSVEQAITNIRICDQFSSEVAPDDVLDAMVAALTATVEECALQTLPSNPPSNWLGLPKMVFANRADVDI